MRKQLGMSLGGLLLLLLLIIFMVYAAARIVPAYMDYWALEHIMENALQSLGDERLTPQTIRSRFVKELNLNNIKTVTGADLVIEPTQAGYKLTAEYSVKEPFWREIHLCMDFKAERESK
ncbi:MAG TPA: DUF4845 domain-containing protein [Thiobacillaceae bacterium]|nr:DUF4845 domain-containing protein [Thiobacillaceae bacterium]HNU64245.1 DUF4845 domain-containing protein [Thiobacillaceae bacterium]